MSKAQKLNTFSNIGNDIKRKVLDYVKAPTVVGWYDLRGLVIAEDGTTLWEAWLEQTGEKIKIQITEEECPLGLDILRIVKSYAGEEA